MEIYKAAVFTMKPIQFTLDHFHSPLLRTYFLLKVSYFFSSEAPASFPSCDAEVVCVAVDFSVRVVTWLA